MKKSTWMIAAVLVQALLLLGLVGRHAYTLYTGVPITLKTAPRDPWDPFRGEHVILNYEISNLDTGKLPMVGKPYQSGQPVWVVLQPSGQFHTPVRVTAEQPNDLTGGQVALRGTVEYMFEHSRETPEGRLGDLRIRYGIEQFYVPEGEGPKLEQEQANMRVQALVDRFGRAALHKVFVGEREIRWR